jgi:putative membrane protein
MVVWLVVVAVIIAAIVRWFGGTGGGGVRPARTARDVLDERYARGEIDRDEYIRRKQDIAGS